ncbi:hypothetical protein SO694_00007163 [Aureococcus anophagefferens]|uniref:Cullin family profile domain-containing protein n=1 Tax=Aureococcus anophagefferens TaxID=44056 RepID=A0ABR1GB49_AURAN
MSVFASPSKTTVDMDEINKVLWPVYVRAALRGATISRCEVVGTVQKREWLKLLRGGGLDGAQATLVYYAETAKHERRCFTYSAFKRALCVVACRLEPELRPSAAFVRFVDRLAPRWPTRSAAPIAGARAACAAVLDAFAPCLAKVFAFFATAPTTFETKVLRRHGAREDVDRMQQSLTFAGWAGFAATFAFADRLGPDAVSAIFVDSVAVEAADELGGLTLEEFHDAVLRAALLVSATPGGGSEDIPGIDLALKPRRSARAPSRWTRRAKRSPPTRRPSAPSPASGSCGALGGGRAVSSNYSLLIEGSKEFSTLADQCWSNLKKNTAKLLASTRRATSRGEELTDLMDDLTMTRPAPDAARRRPTRRLRHDPQRLR